MLICIAIAVGTAVIIFITTLMNGLQKNTINKTLGSQPHIRLEAARMYNRTPAVAPGQQALLLESMRAQPLQRIDSWQALMGDLDAMAVLPAVSPVVSGPALAQKGRATASVMVTALIRSAIRKLSICPKTWLPAVFIWAAPMCCWAASWHWNLACKLATSCACRQVPDAPHWCVSAEFSPWAYRSWTAGSCMSIS